MIPVVSIVGRKNSGKTTLIKGIVPELKKRGYRAAVIKHSSHELNPEDVDRPGKDTYEHQLAGAETVVLSAPNKLVLMQTGGQDIDTISRTYLQDMDIILTEGYKLEHKPKIEIFRLEIGQDEGLLCTQKSDNLIAVVSDHRFETGIPYFGLDDYARITDFLENKFILKKQVPQIQLVVDQKNIPLNGFVRKFMQRTILSMISSLRGVPDEPQRVEITFG